ncbi:MAG TPA: hypothetical protein VNA04_17950 [Thermoanaerobaculia bacterium]|nr:hypothetical protein [Thermoanaerobaculia bacterium]
MPSPAELLGLLLVVFAVWLLWRVARLVIRLILLGFSVAVIAGAAYWLFVR